MAWHSARLLEAKSSICREVCELVLLLRDDDVSLTCLHSVLVGLSHSGFVGGRTTPEGTTAGQEDEYVADTRVNEQALMLLVTRTPESKRAADLLKLLPEASAFDLCAALHARGLSINVVAECVATLCTAYPSHVHNAFRGSGHGDPFARALNAMLATDLIKHENDHLAAVRAWTAAVGVGGGRGRHHG